MKNSTYFRRFLALALLALAWPVWGQVEGDDFTVGGIHYMVINTSPREVGVLHPWNGSHYSGTISIPETVVYAGLSFTVTDLIDSAFFNCSGLRQVYLPATIDTVGYYVFYGTNTSFPTDTLKIFLAGELPPVLMHNATATHYGAAGSAGQAQFNHWANSLIRVPCHANGLYQQAYGWNVVSNLRHESTHNIINDHICLGDDYIDTLHNAFLYSPNTGTYNFQQPAGWPCVYSTTLHLTVYPKPVEDYYFYYCDDASYHSFNGFGFNEYAYGEADFQHLGTSMHGCDSTARLHFRPMQSSATFYDRCCEGHDYARSINYNGGLTFVREGWQMVGDTVVITKNIFPQNDEHTVYYHAEGEPPCSQTVVMRVAIDHALMDTTRANICQGDSYTWHSYGWNEDGSSYSRYYQVDADTTITDSIYTLNGCNYLRTLSLHTMPTSDTVVYRTICGNDSVLFNGLYYSRPGQYQSTFRNRYGCDSTVTLHLSVMHAYDSQLDFDGKRIAYSDFSTDGDQSLFYTFDSGSGNNHWRVQGGKLLVSGAAGGDSYNLLYTTNRSCTVRFNTNVYDSIEVIFPYEVGGEAGYDYLTVTLNGMTNTYNNTTGVYHRKFANTTPNTYMTLTLNWRNDRGGGVQPAAKIDYIEVRGLVDSAYNHARPRYEADICQGESYTFGDLTLSTAGDHLFHFTTTQGCDSNVVLNLAVHATYDDTIPAVICDRQTYTFGDSLYSTAGVYTHRLSSRHGCDSISTLSLTVNPVSDREIYDTVRGDNGYQWYGQTLTTSGDYLDTLPNRYQCDSITLLHLTIYNTAAGHIYAEICDNEYFDSADFHENTAGLHSITGLHTVVGGADSTSYLHLTVHATYDDTIPAVICDRQTYTFGDSLYSTAGVYTHQLSSRYGCDSISTLSLTVNPINELELYDTVRGDEGYSWYGHTLTTSGDYLDTMPNRYQCDSITLLHLTIYNTAAGHIYAEICDNEYFDSADFHENTAGLHSITGLHTVVGGADSTSYLHLTVHATYDDTIPAVICDRQTYTFGDSLYSTAGVYTHQLSSRYGCDSISTLSLTVNPINELELYDTVRDDGGYDWYGHHLDSTGVYLDTLPNRYQCDSITLLHLTIYNTARTDLYDTICQGLSYEGYGFSNLTATGLYEQRLLTYGGADSVVWMHLQVNPVYDDTLVHHICDRTTYSGFGDHELSETGYTTDSLSTWRQCDSVVTLHLIVDPVYEVPVYDTLRGDEPYDFLGTWIDSTGLYTDTLPSLQGCDSIIHLQLQVYKNAYTHLYDTICDRDTYEGYGFADLTAAGTYVDSLLTEGLSDSVIILHLWVNPVYEVDEYDTICSNRFLVHHGDTLTQAGIYIDTLRTLHGCDSIVTFHLYVRPAYFDTTWAEICDNESYSFHYQEHLTDPGVYHYYMTAFNGCDSVETLMLDVHPTYDITLYDSILPTRNYQFGSHTLYDPGFYTDSLTSQHGCDSVVHLVLSHWYLHTARLHDTICQGDSVWFNDFWRYRDSVYTDTLVAASDGEDSLVVLFLKVNPVYNDTLFDSIFCTQWYLFGEDSLNVDTTLTHYLQSIHGCDSVVTLNLHIHTVRDLDTAVCMDQLPVVWRGIVFFDTLVTEPTLLLDTAIVWNDTAQRDIMLALHLTVVPNPIQTIADTIVENQLPYNFRGHIYTGNVEADTLLLPATEGCDTTTYYSLFYHPNVSAEADSTICWNQLPFTWNGVTFTAPEGIPLVTRTTTLLAHTGADSVLTMHLHLLQNSYTTRHDTIVENQLPYTVHGHIYFSACPLDTLVLPNAVGCDSVIYFRLIVNNNGVTMLDTALCDYRLPLNWNGRIFNDPVTHDLLCDTTIYLDRLGADSMVIMRVHILRCTSTVFDSTVCSAQLPLRWMGRDFAVPQDMPTTLVDTIHLYTPTGADSLIILRLRVNETFNQTFFDTTCSNHPYIFLGQPYATSATLTAGLQTRAGCDSNVVVHLKVWPTAASTYDDIICPGTSYYWIDGQTYHSPISGPTCTLRTLHGCDSVVTLNLRLGEEAHAVIASNKTWVEADDQMVRLVDDTPHGRSRLWRFPDSTSSLMLVNYAYPIDYDSVRIYLTATNHDGCQDTASILLRLDRDFVWAPNAFTPDLSENSLFRIFGDGLLNVKVHVYNRAGLLVASWEGLEGSWDGKHNGIPCPQAAYTYKVTYTTLRHPRDPQQKVGTVLLLR